jgi:hypothetical protein
VNVVCFLVGHHRSIKRARRDAETDGWISACKRCGEPMVRVGQHRWVLQSEIDKSSE